MKRYTRKDTNQEFTNSMIDAIENGKTLPWVKPWSNVGGDTMPTNAATKKRYNGSNVIWLWLQANKQGYTSQKWASYKQWQSIGAQVKKGESASAIIFFKKIEIKDKDTNEKKVIPFVNQSAVFNAEQVDNYTDPDLIEIENDNHINQIAAAENMTADYLAATNIVLTRKGNSAFYRMREDTITTPEIGQFKNAESLHATDLHEIIHSTGHSSRLDRLTNDGFGSVAYAKEELTAEMGAAIACSLCGIPYNTQHTNYIKSWLKVLKEDKKALINAASKAQKAVDFLLEKIAENKKAA